MKFKRFITRVDDDHDGRFYNELMVLYVATCHYQPIPTFCVHS